MPSLTTVMKPYLNTSCLLTDSRPSSTRPGGAGPGGGGGQAGGGVGQAAPKKPDQSHDAMGTKWPKGMWDNTESKTLLFYKKFEKTFTVVFSSSS